MPTLTTALAQFAAAVAAQPDDLPPPVAALAPNLMLNAAAAALAAAAHPDAVALAGIARAMGGNGRSTLIGMGQRTSPVYAALVNGALIRLLDFDDHIPNRANAPYDDIRPTAAVLPAVLALGEMHGTPGNRALAAYAAGAEIIARLSNADININTNTGANTTTDTGADAASRALAAIAPSIGAAVASAIILNLDAAAIAHAITLAAGAPDASAITAGVINANASNAGAPDRRHAIIPTAGPTAPALAAGRAAMHGVMSALQAQAGIAAAPDTDDRPDAADHLSATAGIPGILDDLLDGLNDLSQTWRLVSDPGISIRLYPCHPAAHAIIDALLGLTQLHRFAPDDIAAVHLALTPHTLAQLPWILPADGWQARAYPAFIAADGWQARAYPAFIAADGWQARACPAFIAAATLCHGPPLINYFSDAAIRDPGVRAMLPRISVEASLPPSPLAPHPAEAAITLNDGRTLRHRVDHPRGAPAMPLDDDDLEAKFLYCTRYILPADHIDEAVTGFRTIAANPNITGMVSVLGG